MNQPLLSELAVRQFWPDAFDLTFIYIFAGLVIVLPAVGYYFLVVDFRAWLRRLRRALILVANFFPEMPAWARRESPPCLRALGLTLPCTEEDVKRAYREKAEELHPDRGGDKQRFFLVQEHFENALEYVRSYLRQHGKPDS